MAKILDGSALAKEIRAEVAAGVLEMQEKHQVTPGLAAILVGDDPGSAIYVRNKRRACGEAGLMVTSDEGRAERARQFRTHGQTAPYVHSLLSGNGRLDAVQAAILRVRLPHVATWNDQRRANAALYDKPEFQQARRVPHLVEVLGQADDRARVIEQ